jgi:hypothetical protein
MAVLRHPTSGRQVHVEAEHLVGRSPRCTLPIAEAYVSAQHAAIRWTGQRWELKDLGSRNGTFVNEQRLAPGAQEPISPGTKICFGHATQEWILEDAGAPNVMVTPAVPSESDGPALVAESGLIVVPSAEDPLAVIYRGADGQWLLERQDDALTPIEDQATFDVAGRTWRFCCPNVVLSTSFAAEQLEINKLTLHFLVSRDEEHVELRVETGGESLSLGARTHHYLLLTLARLRLKEVGEGLPDTACGWIYQDELVEQLNVTPTQLHVEVFRIRQQFASLKFKDFASVIERRPRSRQLRIGVANLTIEIL